MTLSKEEVLAECLETEKRYNRKYLSDLRRFLDTTNRHIKSQTKKNNETLRDVYQTVSSHEKKLKEMIKTIQCVDETLCNVLMAIRQNEYLQAYYPAQHGFPDLKVVGTHPAKTTEKVK